MGGVELLTGQTLAALRVQACGRRVLGSRAARARPGHSGEEGEPQQKEAKRALE